MGDIEGIWGVLSQPGVGCDIVHAYVHGINSLTPVFPKVI